MAAFAGAANTVVFKRYHMNRRHFVKQAGIIVTGSSLPLDRLQDFSIPAKNKLPKWKGFNLLDFFSPNPADRSFPVTLEQHCKWMQDWGFDFVRIPIAYPTYLSIDRTRPIHADETYQVDEKRVEAIDRLVQMAFKYNLHVNLNLHRAPGYCINAGFHEPFNLWKDETAQKAFYHHWAMWARLYKNVSAQKISFNLLNEPAMREDMNDQHSPASVLPGALYRKVVAGATEVIHKENPQRLVIADGNAGYVVPELVGSPVHQSCRGYHPGEISHYKAPWAHKDPDHLPAPKWPGKVGDRMLSRAMLEDFYAPWIELVRKGVGVHCGECGCYSKTPHPVFLAWFEDVLDILSSNGIGFALWNFAGDFGVINSNRADVAYENWYGAQLDRKLLDLLKKY